MKLTRSILTIAFVAVVQQALAPQVRAQPAPAPDLEAILANPKVAKTLDDIKVDDERTFAEQKRITEIPAPPFKEKVRAEYYLKRMQELGFKDAAIDSEGNVIALRKGSGGGRPKLVVSAHLDTVFPEGTDVTVNEKDGAIIAPGIGDDSRGLAALLSLITVMNANEIKTVGDIMFVGTVGEEELGNLRGVKALFRDHKDIDGFISIDGLGITRVVNQATGSRRYEFTFKGPGGHSFQEFGLPSATHAMGRAIAKIAELQTPSDPKTTFTVGTVSGGTSVNAIAAEARMAVDMRSDSTDELAKLEARLLELVKEAVADENARWKSDKMAVEARTSGVQAGERLVRPAERAFRAVRVLTGLDGVTKPALQVQKEAQIGPANRQTGSGMALGRLQCLRLDKLSANYGQSGSGTCSPVSSRCVGDVAWRTGSWRNAETRPSEWTAAVR